MDWEQQRILELRQTRTLVVGKGTSLSSGRYSHLYTFLLYRVPLENPLEVFSSSLEQLYIYILSPSF